MTKLIDSWEEWGKVYADPDFWQDEMKLICRSNGIEIRSIDGTVPGTHAVFYINDDIVLKMFCPVRHHSYAKELELHSGLFRDDPMYPQVRFHGKSPGGYDYIAFTRFSGKPLQTLRRETIPEDTIRDFAYAIADLQMKTLARSNGISCLVHYDLSDDHVFIRSDGSLEGIIDFGDAIMGHPADDLPVIFICCLQGSDSLIAVFRSAYNERAKHYKICDKDLADAVNRYAYREDIIGSLQGLTTRFAKDLLARL